jgi:hypothetical protein
MRKLVVQVWMTLDGVVQAPGAPDEDPRGGFAHGGWSLPYFDDAAMTWTVENLSSAGCRPGSVCRPRWGLYRPIRGRCHVTGLLLGSQGRSCRCGPIGR